jgi:hypothetical protein
MHISRYLLTACLALASAAHAQTNAPTAPPNIDEQVAQIPQTALATPWAFIGYAITTPDSADWFVATSTPRGATMGRDVDRKAGSTAVLVFTSEILDKPVDSDTALLQLARARHAKIGERWVVSKHEEKLVRHAGTRCSRHELTAREPEDLSPRAAAAKANAARSHLLVTGLSCVHPTDPTLLVEIGASERGTQPTMNPALTRDAEAVISSLAFHRFSEQALQKSAEAARVTGLADAEAVLKPYIEADAAWARYFLAQILERAQPAPDKAAARMHSLLAPAAERGLADAQWALGTLLLRGGDGVAKDPAMAEALLRRAAERGNPGAAFQLGLSLLSGAEGITADPKSAILWIQRAAVRGLKEAQAVLREAPRAPAKK